MQSPQNREAQTQHVRSEVQATRASLLSTYQKICGDCFEDPESQIHKLWMSFNLAESSFNASSSIPFDQRNPSASGVDSDVYRAFMPFLQLDLEAREIYQELIELGATYTSDPELDQALRSAREELIQRDAQLCGSHDQDFTAPLPKARKKYEVALSSSVDPTPLKKKLDLLEKQHAVNVRNIYLFDQMLAAPYNPEKTVSAIVQRNIDQTVAAIQSQIIEEQTRQSRSVSSPSYALGSPKAPRGPDLGSVDQLTPPPSDHVDHTPNPERVEAVVQRHIEQTPPDQESGSGWGWPAVIIGTIVLVPLAAFGAYHYLKSPRA
ncbi:MAG: hypothetical protein JSR93_05350 [Verrucomicrobia bacterium]|nr:hypothetical protein [Verrucomicrobiota bacterium]